MAEKGERIQCAATAAAAAAAAAHVIVVAVAAAAVARVWWRSTQCTSACGGRYRGCRDVGLGLMAEVEGERGWGGGEYSQALDGTIMSSGRLGGAHRDSVLLVRAFDGNGSVWY
eukprot:2569683-Pleurochrysis_carterae.AAC.2